MNSNQNSIQLDIAEYTNRQRDDEAEERLEDERRSNSQEVEKATKKSGKRPKNGQASRSGSDLR